MNDPLEDELRDALGDPGAHELRALLHRTDAAWTAPPRRRRLPARRWLLAAAAVLLLTFVGWWAAGHFGAAATPQELYAVHYSPYAAFSAERGASAEETRFARAEAAYRAGDYTTAYTELDTLVAAVPANTLYRFLRGQAALASGRTTAAIADFDTLSAQPDHLFVEQSRWYLALTYLKTGEEDRATAVLETIEPGRYRYAAARAVLEALR